jgi:hypothetical protein
MPSGIDIRNDQSGKIGPHIDVRGTGGFVVCPPSIQSGDCRRAHMGNRAAHRTPSKAHSEGTSKPRGCDAGRAHKKAGKSRRNAPPARSGPGND